MSSIKPIETIYNGYRFRSRLEARWAVFFDACYIEYEYEPEGYELSDGTKYLPDFYLPKFDLFVEIKNPSLNPAMQGKSSFSSEEFQKLKKLAQGTDKQAIIFFSPPMETWGLLYTQDFTCSSGGWSEWYATFSEENWPILLVMDENADRSFAYDCTVNLACASEYAKTVADQIPQMWISFNRNNRSLIITGALAARQARFEHGENPRL